jgi:SAM-dependent methyltransferase
MITTVTPAEAEAARILAEYERREREIGRDLYALTRPANLFIRHGQERALLRGLMRGGALPLAGRRVLEIGCGRGQWFTVFENFGASRERLAGIDLDPVRIGEARARFPGADLRAGDATALPWSDASFDVVFQSTVLSSVLDAAVRRAIAAEMRRVTARGGIIVSYDLAVDNPRNPNVRAVRASELAELFTGCGLDVERVTLAPPIARRLAPRSWLSAALLEKLRFLNTHQLAVISRANA